MDKYTYTIKHNTHEPAYDTSHFRSMPDLSGDKREVELAQYYTQSNHYRHCSETPKVHLLGLQIIQDHGYKYILKHPKLFSMSVTLRALKTKSLVIIFFEIRPTSLVRADNGAELFKKATYLLIFTYSTL